MAETTDQKKTPKVVLRYVGDDPIKNPEGRHFFGVPQRDLTEDDKLPEGITISVLHNSGIYVDPTKDKKE